MERRVAANHKRKPDERARTSADVPAVDDEGELHRQIMAWCDSQWPRVKYRHSRMDRPTRDEIGCEDFTIFLPAGKTLHVEVKRKGSKQTPEQLAWAAELARLGHTLHVVRSFEQFAALAQSGG
jgi:hypothetical protein